MGDFGDAERRILTMFKRGETFMLSGKDYEVDFADKPTCAEGEPKTDIYILAKSKHDTIEIKISYKKENADFIENKIGAERAKQLFGDNWKEVVIESTGQIKEEFMQRMLIYKNAAQKTEAGAITLGWKFEFVNKNNGELSGEVILDREQLHQLVLDVYAGINLDDNKKNATVLGKCIKDSGVANYLLMDDKVQTVQEVIDKMVSIEEYVDMNPKVYFACKALNLRSFVGKYKGEFKGKFIGKIDGKIKGRFQRKIDKNKYDEPYDIDATGKFEGIIDGYLSGIAEGKFHGDMSDFILSNKVNRRSTSGTFKPKWDSDRPLAVQVNWTEENGKLSPKLIFDEPFMVKGNGVAERLIMCMKKMDIHNTDDINENNAGTDRMV